MKNQFLKGFLNLPSRDHCVNNDNKFGLAELQNIRACQQYIVCGGYYLSIYQRMICLKGAISYQGSLKQIARKKIVSNKPTLHVTVFIHYIIWEIRDQHLERRESCIWLSLFTLLQSDKKL